MPLVCSNRGFTLIELLIALVVISLGLMGLYSMVVTIHGNTFRLV